MKTKYVSTIVTIPRFLWFQLTANGLCDFSHGRHQAGTVAADGIGGWSVDRGGLAGSGNHDTVVAFGVGALASIAAANGSLVQGYIVILS
jgi:hypothetical protein